MIFQNRDEYATQSLFREELINTIGQVEERATNRANQMESFFNSRIAAFQSKHNETDAKLTAIFNKISSFQSIIDSVKELVPAQKKLNESFITNDIRLSNLSKEIHDACYKYDKLFLDNFVISGQVGEYCRYKTMKDFVLMINEQISSLNSFKDKANYDIKLMKDKVDKMSFTMQSKIDASTQAYNSMLTERLAIIEKDYKDKIKEHLDSISETKIENSKYYAQMKESTNELKLEVESIRNIKNEVIATSDVLGKQMKENSEMILGKFNQLKTDYLKMYKSFSDIVEFIKDVRFKKNINTEVSKLDVKNLLHNLETPNTQEESFQIQSNGLSNLHRRVVKSPSSFKSMKSPLSKKFGLSKKPINFTTLSKSESYGDVNKKNKKNIMPIIENKMNNTSSSVGHGQDFNTTIDECSSMKKRRIPKIKKKPSKTKTVKTLSLNPNNNEYMKNFKTLETQNIFCNVTVLHNESKKKV